MTRVELKPRTYGINIRTPRDLRRRRRSSPCAPFADILEKTRPGLRPDLPGQQKGG